ncbi:MAG: nitrogenase component 1 [Eubacteriales bacterium]|nr:nitrogenase component 1 [Eubacteriales bacterium]
MDIAVYGKGGIGKSTVSANLSAALAGSGARVMQIGCDPKHDSTRLLMHGESLPTVLEYLRTVGKENGELSEILKEGSFGVGCIEAGGPRPGVGCAGRGIISAFEFLDRHRAREGYDVTVYDVLGDVVCGGFAVPVRREYADAVFLVTSGEFMALYAANNILRGIRNFDGDKYQRVAGIIYNERLLEDEDGRVRRFAEAVGLPICAKVPRSSSFARAEQQNRTLMELEDCQAEQEIFRGLAGQISDEMRLYEARPLSDEELERVVLSKEQSESAAGNGTAKVFQREDRSEQCLQERQPERREAESERPQAERPPLYGCAFNGAATAAVNLTDALVIVHSPRACAFYTWQNISSPGRKNLYNRGILMPSAISPHLECTDMKQEDVVFGGMDRLRTAVREAMKRGPKAIIVISSCVSGIIGDDIRQLEEWSTEELPVITIPADGDIAGDYMEGIRLCLHTIAGKLIDRSVAPQENCVNLIGEAGVGNNRASNYRIFQNWMQKLGIRVNCRFLGGAKREEVNGFLRAPLNLLAADTADNRELKDWLTEQYGCRFLEGALPVGAAAAERWLRKLGVFFDCEEQAEALISGQMEAYQREIEALRPQLAGKRVFLTTINVNLDWLLSVLVDLGMEVCFIGVLNYLRQTVKVSDHPEKYPIDEAFNGDRTEELLADLKPDIVVANYATQKNSDAYLVDALPMTPAIGFTAGIEVAKRWAQLLRYQRKGGWMDDRALFEKYFS